ncbi:MAG: hypothetical protein DIU76_07385 [Bacillota bacterium]|nr:MAG: hypothetical protein DIU76_07385 [Bacillota bacterium]
MLLDDPQQFLHLDGFRALEALWVRARRRDRKPLMAGRDGGRVDVCGERIAPMPAEQDRLFQESGQQEAARQ